MTIKQFIDSVADEFGYHAFGGFVGGEVRDTEGMFGLTTGPDYRRGIVGDGRVALFVGGRCPCTLALIRV